MQEPKKIKWYYSVGAVVSALLCFGPLALPLLFLSPRFNIVWKILISIIILALTLWLITISGKIYLDLINRIEELKQIYGLK